jgi:ribosomal protein S18 acetylase RimI-like enzyme
MEKNLNIRDYQSSDYSEVADIWEQTGMGGKFRGDDHGVIERTIESGGKLLILELPFQKKIIGTSWLTQDGRRVYMHHFAIHPEHQGKGYAKLLLKATMEFAKSTGLQIKLEVHRNNIKALNLYKKGGFLNLGDYEVYIIREYNQN